MDKTVTLASALALAAALVVPGLSSPAHAEETTIRSQGQDPDGLSLDFAVNRFQDDFALSGAIGSPTFVGDLFRLSLSGGVAWTPQGLDDEGRQTWEPYGHARLVVESGWRADSAPLRLYAYGGVFVALLPDALSQETAHVGGVGGFGFEFFFEREEVAGPVSYFVELGGLGISARAEALPQAPLLANGFLATGGFRVRF